MGKNISYSLLPLCGFFILLLAIGCVPYYPVVNFNGRRILKKQKNEIGGGVSLGYYIDGGLEDEFKPSNEGGTFNQNGLLANEYGKPSLKLYYRKGLLKNLEVGGGLYLPYDIGAELYSKYAFWENKKYKLTAMTGFSGSYTNYNYEYSINRYRGEREEYDGKSYYLELPFIISRKVFDYSAAYLGVTWVYTNLELHKEYFLKDRVELTNDFSYNSFTPKITLGFNLSNDVNSLYFELNLMVVKNPENGVKRLFLFPGFSFSNIF